MEHEYVNGVCVTCEPDVARAESEDLVCHACAGQIDLETAALLTALNELDGISRAIWDESKHPRGHGGKFRSLADHLKEAIQQHRESGGAGAHPLHGYNREQLRRVAKARGVQLDRGESHESIRDKLMGHFGGGHHETVAGHTSGSIPDRHAAAAAMSAASHDLLVHGPNAHSATPIDLSRLSEKLSAGKVSHAEAAGEVRKMRDEVKTPHERRVLDGLLGEMGHESATPKKVEHVRPKVANPEPGTEGFHLIAEAHPDARQATPGELADIRKRHPIVEAKKPAPRVKKRTEAEIRQDLNHSGGFDVVAGREPGKPHAPSEPEGPKYGPIPVGSKLTDEHLKAMSSDELHHHIGKYSYKSATGQKLRAESHRRTTEVILKPSSHLNSTSPAIREREAERVALDAIRDTAMRQHGDRHEYVPIADVRDEMARKGFGRDEQDAAFRKLANGVNEHASLIPLANTKALTERDRAAALEHGGDQITVAGLRRPGEMAAKPVEAVPGEETAQALAAAGHGLMQNHSSSNTPILLGLLANKIRARQIGPAEAAAEARKLRDSLPEGPEREALTGLLGSMGGIKPPGKRRGKT